MKILIASSSITLQGGVPAYNKELCSMLNHHNEVHLLVEQDICSYPGFSKVFSIPSLSIESIEDSIDLLNRINAENYDIIINSNSHIISLLAPYLSQKTKLIGTSHSLRYTESDVAAFNSEYVDSVIALSTYNKSYLDKKFNLSLGKCRVVPNFVSSNLEADTIRKIKKENDVLSIVYVGGGAPTKSPELVVKILRKLLKTDLNFKFIWLGVNTPPLKKIQPFSDMSCLIPDDKRVDYRGRVSSQEASEVISNANIFLCPSRREGCPMSLLEALSVGTIPLTSDYDIANKEIIKHGENGFVIPHNDASLFVDLISDIIVNHCNYSYVYENSYATFSNSLTYNEWEGKMKDILSCDVGINHIHRLPSFDRDRYKRDLDKFRSMKKKNRLHMMWHETIPSALSCLFLYLKYHRNQ